MLGAVLSAGVGFAVQVGVHSVHSVHSGGPATTHVSVPQVVRMQMCVGITLCERGANAFA